MPEYKAPINVIAQTVTAQVWQEFYEATLKEFNEFFQPKMKQLAAEIADQAVKDANTRYEVEPGTRQTVVTISFNGDVFKVPPL